VVTGAFGKV